MRYEDFKKINFDDYKDVIERERNKKLQKGNKKILLNEIITTLVEMHNNGVSYKAIAVWLSEKGIKVSDGTIRNVINKYLGNMNNNNHIISKKDKAKTENESTNKSIDAQEEDEDKIKEKTPKDNLTIGEKFRQATSARMSDIKKEKKKEEYKPPIADEDL